jgi:hypothetical protein
MNLLIRRGLATGAGIALSMGLSAAAWAQSPAAADSGSQPQKKIQLVPARAQLDNTLDTKKAKQGEAVTAKLVEGVEIPDAQALPKNTVLEGHVDQVQASDHKSDSMMVITFDKAKLKDGQELPIKATILAMAEPPSMQAMNGGGPATGAAPPSAGAMGSGGGSSPSGSGSSGSASSGSGSSAAVPAAQPTNMPQANAGSPQAQQNGVPDVNLKSDIHEHNSAMFMSKGKNVHVPDGTQMEVALAIIPAGVKLQ